MQKLVPRLAGWLAGLTGRSTEAPCAVGTEDYARARQRMVAERIAAPGREISDLRVLDAMRRVPRHEFVPEHRRSEAYEDHPVSIGHDQTISQPYVVALMTQLLELNPTDRVLEIGAGSGYQTAVLAEVVAEVYTIEIVEDLVRHAAAHLTRLGYTNVHVRVGDGCQGWPEAAPFDGIIVTCAPERVPGPLVEQLKDGGRMVIPVGGSWKQDLVVLRKRGDRLQQHSALPVVFVPMTGQAALPCKP